MTRIKTVEGMRGAPVTRRQALDRLGAPVAGPAAAFARGQAPTGEAPRRLAPIAELVNVLEYEEMARLTLPDLVHASVAGSDRRVFDRMTFRPRLMASHSGLDLSVTLFGDELFAPILVGPMADQRMFHPEGELETARGASAAKTAMVVSSQASYPIQAIAAQATAPLWYQVYAGDEDLAAVQANVRQAEDAGCRAVCITVGVSSRPTTPGGVRPSARIDWRLIDQLRQTTDLPVLLKGIMTPADATAAIELGAEGIVVSNHGRPEATIGDASMTRLPPIVEAVNGRVPVLVDGSFRRGSDILKALALGARAVLLGRPSMWGLAAYGALGVQSVLELLQRELGRSMAGAGRPRIATLDPTLVRIHSR